MLRFRIVFGFIMVISLIFSCDKEIDIHEGGDVSDFNYSPVKVVNDVLNGVPIVVAGTSAEDLMVAFKSTLDGVVLDFKATPESLPSAFIDQNGTTWDIFGHGVSGIDSGKKLEPAFSMTGFWFSFATFYPGISIHPNLDPGPNEGEMIVGSGSWTVPSNEILDGGPGKDGIPAIGNPEFIEAKSVDFLNPDDLVVGYFDGIEYKAYPHKILNWHEIVNDKVDSTYFSIIYCPLTGTATCWSGNQNNESTSFGVSGLLYNSNIIAYDRKTNNYWSQIKGEAIQGSQKGTIPEIFTVVETNWQKWREIYPRSKVLSTDTKYSRDYDRYPYGNYNEIDADYLIFNVKYDDKRLPKKQRVFAVIEGGMARVYKLGL